MSTRIWKGALLTGLSIALGTLTMAATDWWASDWQQLPVRRIGLTGETNEPLTFQWAGGLQELQDILQRNGWRTSAAWTPLNALNWLTDHTDPADLPVIPLYASGRLPRLTLVRPHGDGAPAGSRLALRLWVVDFELTNGRTAPLWMGSVVEERFYHPLSLITLTSTQPDVNAPRSTLAAAFDDGRLLPRTEGTADGDWDGKVLLVRMRPVKSSIQPRNAKTWCALKFKWAPVLAF
jgi:undecaprenyl-diphosphatase